MKNKKILLLLLSVTTLLISVKAQSNIAINSTGTVANTAAILDLTNTASASGTALGLLLPQVPNTTALPPTAPQGLLYFNTLGTGTIAAPMPSLYVNTSTTSTSPAWTPISSAAISDAFTLSGTVLKSTINSITSSNVDLAPLISAASALSWVVSSGNTISAASTAVSPYGGGAATPSFVGTKSAQDFVLVANNTERMRIANSAGNVGIGTVTPQSNLEVSGSLGTKFVVISTNNYTLGAAGVYFINNTNVTNLILPASGTGTGYCNCNNRRYVLINATGNSIYLYTDNTYQNYTNYISLVASTNSSLNSYHKLYSNTSGSNNYNGALEIISDPTTGNWVQIK